MARRLPVLLLAGALILGGCAAQPSATPSPSMTPTATATPSVQPAATPTAAPTPGADGIVLLQASVARANTQAADPAAAATALNAAGLDLLRQVANAKTNLVFSPASIVLCLAMARAGAAGTTASEMDAVLHDAATPTTAANLNALEQLLESRSGTFPGPDGDAPVTLRIANAPFGQVGMNIKPAYLDALASLYGAGLRLVDYIGDTETTRNLINAWVDAQTEHRIPRLLDPGFLTPDSRLTLVNAIYLKAPWMMPFEEAMTQPATFHRGDGTSVTVPFMNSSLPSLKYAAGNGWQAVDLPYVGQKLSMLLIRPDGDLATFEASLTAEKLRGIVGGLDWHHVALGMPRFSIETKTELADTLQALGMRAAFDASTADFSGITDDERLFIARVVHQANIDVDEAGTTAAAATAVGIGATGGTTTIIPLKLDRPFVFVLRDDETGAVLFLGHVADPSVK